MKHAYIVLLALIALLLNGCRSSVASVERERPVGSKQGVADKRVQPDFTLRQKIAVVEVNEAVLGGDLTQVQVALQNLKSKPVTIRYVWEWYNEAGMKVQSDSRWKELRFEGKENQTILSIAPTPQAADFKLKLQESK